MSRIPGIKNKKPRKDIGCRRVATLHMSLQTLVQQITSSAVQYLHADRVNTVAEWNEAFFQSTTDIDRAVRQEVRKAGYDLEPYAGDEIRTYPRS